MYDTNTESRQNNDKFKLDFCLFSFNRYKNAFLIYITRHYIKFTNIISVQLTVHRLKTAYANWIS